MLDPMRLFFDLLQYIINDNKICLPFPTNILYIQDYCENIKIPSTKTHGFYIENSHCLSLSNHMQTYQ